MAKKRPAKTKFIPRNPSKYKGKYPITLRSSWEREFAVYLDLHEGVLEWASETSPIPYRNPITGKQSLYVPDFLVTYIKKNGQRQTKLIEIKPAKEAFVSEAKSVHDKRNLLVNEAKWLAAIAWCKRRGIGFEIITENELFGKKSDIKYKPSVPTSANSVVRKSKRIAKVPDRLKISERSKVRNRVNTKPRRLKVPSVRKV